MARISPESIPDDSGVEEAEAKRAHEEKGMSDEPGGDSIELVAGTVAGRGDGAFEDFAGQPLEEDSLEHDEDEDDRDRARTRPRPVRGDGAPASGREQRQQ